MPSSSIKYRFLIDDDGIDYNKLTMNLSHSLNSMWLIQSKLLYYSLFIMIKMVEKMMITTITVEHNN